MLSSISLGSIDNLEKLPINSLNNICDRVRQALLHVFLPRLCEKCQPSFAETFKKTQSTPLLLKVLCEPCKLSYIKDKRSVSRKKPTNLKPPHQHEKTGEGEEARKQPAKKKTMEHSRNDKSNDLENTNIQFNNFINNSVDNSTGNFNNLTLKIKLISTPKSFDYRLPLTPPPSEEEDRMVKLINYDEDLTIFIDNTEDGRSINYETDDISDEKADNNKVMDDVFDHDNTIYQKFTEKGIDWCRYCGVGGDTGTFWKLGPWGDRSLCHKHGCEFFGCGFARVTRTRLDLTEFYGEKRFERKRPIVSEFCSICWERLCEKDEILSCNGCPISFHKSCRRRNNEEEEKEDNLKNFYCSDLCKNNFKNSLIRPQFPSKSSFPFYRQILQLPNEQNSSSEASQTVPKLKINLKNVLKKKQRKIYRKNRLENQVDRVIAFVPIKVDKSVHIHENIKTPQWIKKSLQERQSLFNSSGLQEGHFDENLDDEFLLNRHARYEHVEKTTRLLKPGVLQQLLYDSSS